MNARASGTPVSARALPTTPRSIAASGPSRTYACDLWPLPVTRAPSTSNDRFHGAPAATRAVSDPVVRVLSPSSIDASPTPPATAPGSSNPPCEAPPSWWTTRTRTIPSRGDDSVTVSTDRLRVAPREVMRAVGAVMTRPGPSAVASVCSMS